MRRRTTRAVGDAGFVDDVSYGKSAGVYDAFYATAGKDYAREADELHRIIQRYRPGSRTLLDVACGTGAHLRLLAARYGVAGVDASPHMLAEARRHLPDVELVEADMRTFSLGRRFDAVTCLFSAIGYMPSTTELDRAVRTMVNHLNERGVLVIDGWIRPEAWRDPGTVDALAVNDDGTAATRLIRSSRRDRISTLEVHCVIGAIEGVEYVTETHTLTLFTDREYRDAFGRAGLAVDVIPSPHPDRDRYIGTLPVESNFMSRRSGVPVVRR
jgi:SAM-dependent methyltransferase